MAQQFLPQYRMLKESERVRRIMGQENVRTVFRPIKILGDMFKKPKELPGASEVSGFYKVKDVAYFC